MRISWRVILIGVAASCVVVAVAVVLARRAHRGPPNAAVEETVLGPVVPAPPLVLAGLEIPPYLAGDTPAEAAARAKAEQGAELLQAGRQAEGLKAWEGMARVDGLHDRGHRYLAQVMLANKFDDQLYEFLSHSSPPDATPEFFREIAPFLVKRLDFRSAHHCFDRVGAVTGDAWHRRAAALCYRLATDPQDADALEEFAAHYEKDEPMPPVAAALAAEATRVAAAGVR